MWAPGVYIPTFTDHAEASRAPHRSLPPQSGSPWCTTATSNLNCVATLKGQLDANSFRWSTVFRGVPQCSAVSGVSTSSQQEK